MDSLIDILTNYGYAGMLISAFLAGSIFPLSSEVVMLALLAAGLDPWSLVIYGTIGNVLGSMLNYGIGMLGRIDWIEKYLHVKKKELDRAQRFMARSLDGLFLFSSGNRRRHNDCARTYALKRYNNHHKHHHRKIPALRAYHLRRGDIRIGSAHTINA